VQHDAVCVEDTGIGAAREQDYVMAGKREAGAKVLAYGTCAKDERPHLLRLA
jgi:hypothetical protein